MVREFVSLARVMAPDLGSNDVFLDSVHNLHFLSDALRHIFETPPEHCHVMDKRWRNLDKLRSRVEVSALDSQKVNSHEPTLDGVADIALAAEQ